jgi:hypothetical protein
MSGCKSGTGLQQLLLLSSDGNWRRLIWVYNYDSRSDESITDVIENSYSECTFLLPEYVSLGHSDWYHIQSSIETLDEWISISIPVSCLLYLALTISYSLALLPSLMESLESEVWSHDTSTTRLSMYMYIYISAISSTSFGMHQKPGYRCTPVYLTFGRSKWLRYPST